MWIDSLLGHLRFFVVRHATTHGYMYISSCPGVVRQQHIHMYRRRYLWKKRKILRFEFMKLCLVCKQLVFSIVKIQKYNSGLNLPFQGLPKYYNLRKMWTGFCIFRNFTNCFSYWFHKKNVALLCWIYGCNIYSNIHFSFC